MSRAFVRESDSDEVVLDALRHKIEEFDSQRNAVDDTGIRRRLAGDLDIEILTIDYPG